MGAWAARNRCGEAGSTEAVTEDVDRIAHRGPPGTGVEVLRVEGGGHAWPGTALSSAVESIVGFTTMTISTTEQRWASQDHPLQAG